jgi:hypothetical protein
MSLLLVVTNSERIGSGWHYVGGSCQWAAVLPAVVAHVSWSKTIVRWGLLCIAERAMIRWPTTRIDCG